MSKNPIIGSWSCPLGAKADVYQNGGHGHHFYTNCECHGWVRNNKPERQQAIWDSAEFISGMSVKRPTNVSDSGAAPVNEPVIEQLEKPEEQEAAVSGDFDPSEREEPKKPETEQEGSGIGKKLIGVGMLLASAAGAWIWTRE